MRRPALTSPCSSTSPNRWTSSQESAPAMVAHRAMIRMSPRACFLVRSRRGAGNSAKVAGEEQVRVGGHGGLPWRCAEED